MSLVIPISRPTLIHPIIPPIRVSVPVNFPQSTPFNFLCLGQYTSIHIFTQLYTPRWIWYNYPWQSLHRLVLAMVPYGSIPRIRFLCLVSMATLVVSGMLLKSRISFPLIDSPLLMSIGITSNNQMFHSCIDIKILMPMNEIIIPLYEYGILGVWNMNNW